jgi:hypothetical protein
VTLGLKTITGETEEMAVAREWLSKHVSTTMNIRILRHQKKVKTFSAVVTVMFGVYNSVRVL